MRIIVFGPTGGTGSQLVAQALAAGHQVTAFARDAAAVPTRAGLAVVAGDTRDAGAVERAVAGQDAVLCALGGRPWRRRARVCSSAMHNIAPAMAKHGVRRIVAISTFGAGDSRPRVGWFVRHVIFGAVLRSEVADKEAMERALAATDLAWTVVRVGVLTDGTARGAGARRTTIDPRHGQDRARRRRVVHARAACERCVASTEARADGLSGPRPARSERAAHKFC